ncbi:MAG TPA: response regulator [Polyangiaceae bacterium]|nr:response regulator [Polyangiaceae bacterium]
MVRSSKPAPEPSESASDPSAAPLPAVLLVDDNRANLYALEALLERLKARTVQATSGEEALLRAAEQEFALVILDVQMPGLDGFATLARLRERERGRATKTPVLFVTAISNEPSYAERAYGLGAVDFITKPIDPPALRSKVAVFLELYEAREAVKRQAALLRARERAASEQRYRFLADATTDLVWTESPDGAITYVSQHFADHTGLDAERARGARWASVVHPDDVPRCAARRAVAAGEGLPFVVECRLKRHDGAYRWFLARVGPRRDEAGAVAEWVGTATDIDDQKRAAAQTDALFEGASVGIALLDRALRFQRVNEAFAEAKGAARHALMGRTAREALPELAPTLEPLWRTVLEAGAPIAQRELEGPTPDAPWGRTWLVNYYPVRVEGETTGVAAVVTDISGRKRVEETLDLLARAGEAFAGSLRADATLATLTRLAVPDFADWCVVYGREPGEAVTQIALAHADPARERELDAMFRRYRIRDDAPYGYPYVMRTGRPQLSPEVTDAMLEAVAVDDEHLALLRTFGMRSSVLVPLAVQGRVFGAIAFARAGGRRPYDPIDLLAAEELARRAALALDNARLYEAAGRERDRAEEANRAKDEFLAVVSHELRSPLNAILGWTRLMRTGRLAEPKVSHALEVIESNAASQAKLIEDLLDVGRITSGKLRLHVAPLQLDAVVRAALDVVRPAADAKGLRLDAALEEDVAFSGDADRLQQVAWNLLTNAVKFTPPGGRVEVRLARKGPQIELSVGDSGRGIDPDLLPHVFERFRQSDAERGRGKGGLGLGLSIVRSLVELHGGTVEAKSDGEGEGACFVVKLPAAPPPHETKPPPRASSAPRAARPLEGLRVLVVDDEPDVRELIETILSTRGAAVTTAESAPEGLELLRAERPDVLVSDISMPGEDGYSLLRKVRKLAPEAGGATPALALTAFARPEDRTQALLAGFTMHLAKPADPNELVIVITKLAERPRLARPSVMRRAPRGRAAPAQRPRCSCLAARAPRTRPACRPRPTAARCPRRAARASCLPESPPRRWPRPPTPPPRSGCPRATGSRSRSLGSRPSR